MPYKYNLSTENIAELSTFVIHVLKDEMVQQMILETNFLRFMTFFLNTYSSEIRIADVASLSKLTEHDKSARGVTVSSETRTEIIRAFSGVALNCKDIASIRSELVTMVKWLESSEPQIQICACLFFGNLVCNPGQFGNEVVSLPGLGNALAQCLRTARRNEVLTSAFDLLQNLAVEPERRKKLGEAEVVQALAHCWLPTAVDLQSSRRALYHTRQLIRGSLPNVYVVFKKESTDTASSIESRPLIYQLLFVLGESADPVSKAEVGRIFAEVWRTLNSISQSQELLAFAATPILGMITENISDGVSHHRNLPRLVAQEIRESFLDEGRSRLFDPLFGLIQSGNESLVTEGWLALSLMAMWKEGALAIYEKFCMESQDNFDLLLNTLQSPKSAPGIDANARFLVAQLANQFVSLLRVR